MNSILSKLLKRRGLKDATELTKEERVDFDNWRKILDREEVTIENVEDFCTSAMTQIEAQFGDTSISSERMSKLALQHAVYKSVRDVISAPRVEKESLIAYLTDLVK